jgi:hypothetical protein
MTTITTMLGFASYNPRREIIYAAAWLIGPFLIDTLSLKPTNVVSQIDRIRENIFGVKTQFLAFTQTNALTKYTWIFLKSFPTRLALSTLFVLAICSDPKTVVDPYMFQSAKYGLATLFSLINLAPNEVKNDKPPKNFPNRLSRYNSTPYDDYLWHTAKRKARITGFKDTSNPLLVINPGGAINVGGYKDNSRPCVTRSQSLPTSPVGGSKHLC